MSAIVTDQFRINNAGNFLGDVNNTANSYYVFVGLSNPSVVNNPNAFGRNESDAQWNDQSTRKSPVDSINYLFRRSANFIQLAGYGTGDRVIS